MDFNDSPEEAAYRAQARTWLDANATLRDPSKSKRNVLDEAEGDLVAKAKAWQAVKTKAGWACLRWPKEFGGRDATLIEQLIYFEEIAKALQSPSKPIIFDGMGEIRLEYPMRLLAEIRDSGMNAVTVTLGNPALHGPEAFEDALTELAAYERHIDQHRDNNKPPF